MATRRRDRASGSSRPSDCTPAPRSVRDSGSGTWDSSSPGAIRCSSPSRGAYRARLERAGQRRALLHALAPARNSAVGLKAGYRYNSVLEHGFSVAITYLASLGEAVAFEGLAGASIFPGAEGRLRRELGVGSVTYGSAAQWFEYGFELIGYPF